MGWSSETAANVLGRCFFRRKSGVSSVLRSKTLAQAEFTSAEHVKSPKVGAPRRGAETNKKPTTWVVGFLLVDDNGFEPLTLRTSSGCSSQLS